MTPEVPTLIYDGECGLCARAVAWVRTNIDPDRIALLPCQDPRREIDFPQVSERACMEAMQLVLPDGQVLSGEQALPHLIRLTKRWRRLAALFALPGAPLVAPIVYRWIARHRYAISAILRHKPAAGPSCNVDGDCD